MNVFFKSSLFISDELSLYQAELKRFLGLPKKNYGEPEFEDLLRKLIEINPEKRIVFK